MVCGIILSYQVMRERALKTCEPNYVPRAAKSFFIPVVHGPLRTVGHVMTQELPSQGGRVRIHEAHGIAGALPYRKEEFGVERHVTAPVSISIGRQGPELRDTRQH
jgi:hypothetical protein